jgi:ABC-type multidrug transport system ATPase subunit/ABC-type transporter Mla maintaining outer membrane lipid asymmetry permease subunit MlaE
MTDATPALSVRGLTIVAPDGRTLVENGAFDIAAGEIVLLIGPSGSGKSTIINLLSGLPDALEGGWQVAGSLECAGHTIDLAHQRSDIGGLVFQDNALFDDLTVRENMQIAADHAPAGILQNGNLQAGNPQNEGPPLVELALSLLPDVDAGKAITQCSGGQRQRVAIARTLLANRPVLFFDEPNSGLDIRSSRTLAGMVRDICRRMGRPAIIVAHHVDDLLPAADRVLLLDSRSRSLRVVERDLAVIDGEMMNLLPGASAPMAADGTVAANPWRGGFRRSSPARWFARYFAEYFWVLCASPLMLLYVAAGGVILGFVGIWFGYNYHAFGGYLRSLLHDETLVGLGFMETAVAVPLLTSVLVVARNNAIIAADLGNRVLSSQFRAMANLRIPARTYLIGSIVSNMVIASLLLLAVALTMATWTSYQTWHLLFPGQPFELWQENYFRIFLRGGPRVTSLLTWVVVKTILSAIGAAAVAVRIGMRQKESVIAINYAIAESIVVGISITLLVHAIVGVLQF